MSAREPTRLYFVRHGESEANAAGVMAGQHDSPLTARGLAQAEAVAQTLSAVAFDRIVTSDLSRCRVTAEIVAARQRARVEVFRELREIDVGDMALRPFDEVHGLPGWTDEGFVRWPGGESLEQVLRRSLDLIHRLVAESPGRRVLVVGHGGVTRILVSHFLRVLPRLERAPATNTNITVVVTDGITYRVEQLFDDAHVV
ncbi:MAG: histidine phosphatase family protein [Candidatus Limnocylindria bacterium]